MNLTKKRWIILIASCFINLCIGSIYAWSVFASPMAEYLSALTGTTFTAGTLAIVFTVTNSVGPITMITGGRINDKFGPKKVIFVGGLIFGIGMILAGYSKSLPMLILTYGVILGLGVGMVYGCTISNSIKFFPDKRGLVGGVTTAAYGLSSVIIPPIANSIINAFDVTMAFKSIGVAFLIIVCVSSFFIEKCPSNFVPEGWTPPANLDNNLNKNDDSDLDKTLFENDDDMFNSIKSEVFSKTLKDINSATNINENKYSKNEEICDLENHTNTTDEDEEIYNSEDNIDTTEENEDVFEENTQKKHMFDFLKKKEQNSSLDETFHGENYEFNSSIKLANENYSKNKNKSITNKSISNDNFSKKQENSMDKTQLVDLESLKENESDKTRMVNIDDFREAVNSRLNSSNNTDNKIKNSYRYSLDDDDESIRKFLNDD